MSEIHRLPAERYKQPFAPNLPLINMLEGLLSDAKEGKMTAAAVAVVYHDDLVPDGATSEGWQCPPGTKFGLTHAIARLQHKWLDEVVKDSP